MKKNSLYLLCILLSLDKTEGMVPGNQVYQALTQKNYSTYQGPRACHYISYGALIALQCMIFFAVYNYNIYDNITIDQKEILKNISINDISCLSSNTYMPFCSNSTPYRQNVSFLLPISNYYIEKYIELVPTNLTEFLNTSTITHNASNPIDTDNLFFGLATILMGFLTIFFNQFHLYAREEIAKLEKWLSRIFFYLFSLGDIGIGITYIVDSIKNNNNK